MVQKLNHVTVLKTNMKENKISQFFEENKIRLLIVSLLIVIPAEILSFFSIQLPFWFEFPIFIIILLLFGKDVFISGIKSLFRLNFADINLLMTIAILGALYLHQFIEAVIIVVLFGLGEVLEEFGINRSQTALKTLVKSTPKLAQIKGKDFKTPIKKVKVGDIIIVRPGDQIPLDGKVIKGFSLVDESTITGEPLPKNKNEGDLIYAGTINGNGYLEIKIIKKAEDSTLSKIIKLTYDSAEKKSKSQKFIEKFAQYYTPTVMLIAAFIIIIPVGFLGQPFTPWFTQALTVLLISCPCALVISTPITIFSAIGNATKHGVVIKGGRYLEELGKLKAIAFDKTRTLTKGEPIVSDIIAFNGFTQKEVIACASGMESLSEHPLARSIIEEAKKYRVAPHEFTDFESIAGKGIKGKCTVCSDSHHCLGNLKFITEEHDVDPKILEQVNEFEKQGKTTIIMSDNKKVTGVIGITDELREDSISMVKSLQNSNINPVILTGDNDTSARFVADQVNIESVHSGLLPEQKVDELNKLIKEYKHVAMVGDGVNDAPSLVTAPVGIAMGAIGSDVAIENADVALMNNNLSLIPYLVKLGKKSNNTIKMNIGAAVSVKILFLVLAVFGSSSLTSAIFADVGVTTLVVLNGLRLFRFKENLALIRQ